MTDASPYVTLGGVNAAEFSISSIPSNSIAASNSTTFQVTFDPSEAGIRSATLSLANDDADENPYDFAIQGTGLAGITFTDGSSFVPAVTAGSTDQAIGRFQLIGDVSGASLTDVSILLNGTRTGLSNFNLWESSDITFGSDTHIGSTVTSDPGDGGSVSFSGFSSTITTGGMYYFLTADVASGATGSVQGEIVENADLIFENGTLSGTIDHDPLSNEDISLPVGLTCFSARCQGRCVILEWLTECEVDNLGFILERTKKTQNLNSLSWEPIASYQTYDALKSRGNVSNRTEYSFRDNTVTPGQNYLYRLSGYSTQGKITVYPPISIEVSALPEETTMEKAYPNPFNPNTYISYQLKNSTRVRITVFDMLGRFVKTLFNGEQAAGSYQVYWNGTDEEGLTVGTGSYIICMETEDVSLRQRVLFIK